MKSGSAVRLSATLDDDAWDDLLSFIEERQVATEFAPRLAECLRSSSR